MTEQQIRHFAWYTAARANFRAALLPSKAEAVQEGRGWVVTIPGLLVHGDAEAFDSALDDAIVALREYAEDWNDRLRLAPNHARHRGVVELVEVSDDDQLRDWLLGGAMTAHRDTATGGLLPACAPAPRPTTTSSASPRSGRRFATPEGEQ